VVDYLVICDEKRLQAAVSSGLDARHRADSLPLHAFAFRLRFRLSLPAIIVYVMAICGLLGAHGKIAYKTASFQPRLSALITAMGVSFFLEISVRWMRSSAKYQAFPSLINKNRGV